jgi:hypothetical protein
MNFMLTKKDVKAPEYTVPYLAAVTIEELMPALKKSTKTFRKLLKNVPEKKIDFAYAEGKWTLKQVVRHLIDAERVFQLRALWFARQEGSGLPGFNENNWAANTDVSKQDWDEMIEEFKAVRKSTEMLFANFSDEELMREGTANEQLINVIGVGFVCAGHVLHHVRLIKDRYLHSKEENDTKGDGTNAPANDDGNKNGERKNKHAGDDRDKKNGHSKKRNKDENPDEDKKKKKEKEKRVIKADF